MERNILKKSLLLRVRNYPEWKMFEPVGFEYKNTCMLENAETFFFYLKNF